MPRPEPAQSRGPQAVAFMADCPSEPPCSCLCNGSTPSRAALGRWRVEMRDLEAHLQRSCTTFLYRLKPFTSYKFRVKATNDIGDSEFSEESEPLTTLQAGQCPLLGARSRPAGPLLGAEHSPCGEGASKDGGTLSLLDPWSGSLGRVPRRFGSEGPSPGLSTHSQPGVLTSSVLRARGQPQEAASV